MDNKILIEELTRIHQIMNNDKGIIIMESNLLMEAGIPKAEFEKVFKGITGFFDRAAKLEAEKVLSQTTEKFSVRLQRYITEKLVTGDVKALGNLIKNVSKVSPSFAEKFVNKNKNLLDDLVLRDVARGERIIKASFGEDILNSYKNIKVNPSPNPKPKPRPKPKPAELKDVSDFKQWIKDNNIKSDIKINPIYDKETKQLWDLHKEGYLEFIKPPSLLNNSDKVKKFQDWLDKNHPDWIDVPLNKSESKGYGTYGPKTKRAYEEYGEKYYNELSLVERMGGVEYEALNPKTLAWWERLLSTDITLSDQIQGAFDKWAQAIIIKRQGQQKYIDDLFSQLKQALDDSVLKLQQGEYADLTMLRNIQQKSNQLAVSNNADLGEFYIKLEKILKEKLPNDAEEVSKLMNNVKSQDPFKMGGFVGEGRWGWLTEFLNQKTGSSKLMNELGGILPKLNKEKAQNISNAIQRIFNLMVIGSPKTSKEVGEYIQKGNLISFKDWPRIDKVVWNNIKNGTLYAGLWGAVNLGGPILISLFKSLVYFYNLFDGGNTEERLGWWDTFWTELKEQWGDIPWFQWIIPVHSYGKDIIDMISKVSEDAFNDKYKGYKLRTTLKAIDDLYNQGKLTPSLYVTSLRGVVPNDPEIISINNSENGFKVFCKLTKLTFEKWDNVNKVGKTNNNQEWVYSSSIECFIEKELTNKVEDVKDDIKPDNFNEPTIDTFYNYIYSLDNRVGKDDLAYMKQDSTNKNKFTFEACLNPPNCNQTEIRTYVFDGTTFVQQ